MGGSSKSEACRKSSCIQGKKRKRSKGEVIEQVVTEAMKAVTEGMKDSDKLSMEMEEKRLKFEEQQKQERQHQLQMMQLLIGSSHLQGHPATDPCTHYYFMYPPQYYLGSGDAEGCK